MSLKDKQRLRARARARAHARIYLKLLKFRAWARARARVSVYPLATLRNKKRVYSLLSALCALCGKNKMNLKMRH